jgi:hypothetical protein
MRARECESESGDSVLPSEASDAGDGWGRGAAGGEVVLHFEDAASEHTFYSLVRVLQGAILCYLVCMSFTASSSPYTGHASNLDHIMLATDILCVDVTSALFVLAGFLCGFVYHSVGPAVWLEIRAQMLTGIYVDLWVSGVVAVLIGSLDALLKHRFKFVDVGLTIFEQATAVRVLDVRQSGAAPHSLNVAAWPAMCAVWCVLSVGSTFSTNDFLRRQLGPVGKYAIMVLAVCGIVLFTLFGMLHSRSNIFYANATAFTYRTLEFNLGIHFLYLLEMNDAIVSNLLTLLHQSSKGILFVFICIWWSEIGNEVVVEQEDGSSDSNALVCLRMFARSNCLRDHHAFLLRGCFLGITLISLFAYAQNSSQTFGAKLPHPHPLLRARVFVSAVPLSWPIYLLVQLIFEMSFGGDLVNRNMPLMSLLQIMFLLASSTLYTMFVQPRLCLVMCAMLGRCTRSGAGLRGAGLAAHVIDTQISDVQDIEDIADIDIQDMQ